MRTLNINAMALLIIGGLNWLLVGLFEFDLVAAIFGGEVGPRSGLSRIVYIVVGIAALYGLTLFRPITHDHSTRAAQPRLAPLLDGVLGVLDQFLAGRHRSATFQVVNRRHDGFFANIGRREQEPSCHVFCYSAGPQEQIVRPDGMPPGACLFPACAIACKIHSASGPADWPAARRRLIGRASVSVEPGRGSPFFSA